MRKTASRIAALLLAAMTLQLFACGNDVRLTAISSGGSQAVFFKINTWGEDAFLDTIRDTVEQFT